MHSLQKMSFSVLLCGVLVASSILFAPTDSLGALPKKKLEIIIGGENFCKDDKDCAGDSFCNMTSHICIICPKPFEWVGGTQCICPSGSVPNADNTDCVECMSDENCQDLKGNLHWVCDTDTNTCACMSGLHEVGGECVCDNPNKTPDEDGNCICQLSQSDCPTSDFTGMNDCKCCPADTPKWDGLECRTCADVNRTKPYYNPSSHTCVECLTDAQCENEEVCSADKKCVCEMTQGDCSESGFMGKDICTCCPLDAPYWNGTQCLPCTSLQPVYNTTRHECTCDESLGYAPDLEDGKCVCKEAIIIPQQAIFARFSTSWEKQLISGPLGPYSCTYNVYVKGHIDDHFLITDDKGTVLYGPKTPTNAQTANFHKMISGSITHMTEDLTRHHMIDGEIFTIPAGTQIHIWAQDTGEGDENVISWERDWHKSEEREAVAGTLELRLVK